MNNYFRDVGRTLIANGYLIVPIRPGEKRPANSGWQNSRMTAMDLGNYPAHGAGVLCGQGIEPVVGIDIDISHRVIGPAVIEWCQSHLGWAPERVGAAPRVMLVYRADTAGWAKGNSLTFFDPTDATKPSGKRNEQQIEVLGLGQQFVAYAVHPDTGKPYEWVDMLGGLEHVKVSELPLVTEHQIEELFVELGRLVRETDGLEAISTTVSAPVTDDDDDALLGLVTKTGISIEEATGHLAQIDNSVGVGYDQWAQFGMTLHHEFDGSSAALTAWEDWSRLSPKHEDGQCARKWKSFGKGSKIVSIRWLIKLANIARRDRVSSERKDALESIMQRIDGAVDKYDLVDGVALEVRGLMGNVAALRADVFSKFQLRYRELTDGSLLPVADVRRLLVDQHKVFEERKKHPLTEFGNAARMIDTFGKGLRFVPEYAQWYAWNETYWAKVSEVMVESLAKKTITTVLTKEAEQHTGEGAAEFYGFVMASQSAKMVKNMVTLAQSDPQVMLPYSELDKHRDWIGCLNGMVNTVTGEFKKPDMSMYVTLSTACNYNPLARCDLYESTLFDAFEGDQALIDFFWIGLGYSIQGNPREDVMFIPYGNGSNGKSSIINSFKDMLGTYAKSADASSFVSDSKGGGAAGGAREDLLRLRGARFVAISEPEENGELRESSVKSITGGDAITARGLYAKTTVEITPTWVPWMATNHLPTIKGQDNGIWRRMINIPFLHDFDNDPSIKKDPMREDRLRQEFEGIFARVIQAGISYNKFGFHPPASILAARAKYRDNMDLTAEWLELCFDLGEGQSALIGEIWSSFDMYSKSRGNIKFIQNSAALGRRLEQRFPSGRDRKGNRIRHGLALKTTFLTDLTTSSLF